jgi:hypothetical protein
MNPVNRALTDQQVEEIRTLVWEKGISQRAVAKMFGMQSRGGSFWKMLHGYAYKNVGGPTGKTND